MSAHRFITLTKGTSLFQTGLPIYVNRVYESFEMMEHSHDFIEICIVGEGAGTHYIDENTLSIKQGDIFFIPVGVSHVIRPLSVDRIKQLVIYNCIIKVSFFHKLLASFPISSSMISFFSRSKWLQFRDKHGEFLRIFEKMYQEYCTQKPCFEAALNTGLMEILLFLYRLEAEHASETESTSMNMNTVLNYIHTNYDQNISLKTVASLRGIGERQFHRIFKKSTNMNLTEYIQSVRIKEACRILQTTEYKINEISILVGYPDIKFFNRLFKKKTGVTPRQYRSTS